MEFLVEANLHVPEDTRAELDALLDALPLSGWMQTAVTPLEPRPDDPAAERSPENAAPS